MIKEEVSVNREAVPTHKQRTHTHPMGLSGNGLPHQAFIMSPDSGIGNLSPSLISLKLQFTWIFVGVLQATSVPADQPDTLTEPFTYTRAGTRAKAPFSFPVAFVEMFQAHKRT